MHLSSHCFRNNISFNQLAVWWFMQEFDQTTSGNFSLRFSPIDFQLYIYNIFLVAYYYTDRIRLFSGDFEFSLSILYMDFSILSRILIAFFLYFCLPFIQYLLVFQERVSLYVVLAVGNFLCRRDSLKYRNPPSSVSRVLAVRSVP